MSDEASTSSTYDRFFDGWRTARTETAKALITQILADLQDYEQSHSARIRRRKAEAQATFETTVEAVILDATHAYLSNDDRPHVVPRSKRVLDQKDQYTPVSQGRMLPDVLDLLENAGWLHQRLGEYKATGRNQRTSISPTSRLLQAIQSLSLTLSDIGRSKAEEVVILKSVKEDYWDKGEYVPYTDNDETVRIRQQLQTFNDWLDQAHIEFDHSALEQDTSVDPSDTRLRRYFSRCSFQSGGRLFGGFWQRLSENERLNGILIEGEDVAEIDYGQIAARILYGLAGVPVPEGDLYDIPGLTTINGQSYRDGIKLLFNSLTFMEHEPTRKPKKSKGKLPSHLKIEQIVDLIRQAHPAIAPYFGTPTGHYVQFRESEVMVNCPSSEFLRQRAV